MSSSRLKFVNLKFIKVLAALLLGFALGVTLFYQEAADAAIKKGKLATTRRQEGFQPEPLPKSGTIAVLVKGSYDHHNASVAALVSQRLVSKGYKVVDPKKLAAIRASRMADAALNGDMDAFLRIGSQYGVGTTITINAQAGEPVVNEFQLLTGTASVAAMAVKSSGGIVYSDTVQGKQVGYTPDEAAQKAIEAAALLAADRMTQ